MAKKKGKRPMKLTPAQDEREARVTERSARARAYRLAKERLHEARHPAASKEAYEAVWEASDDIDESTAMLGHRSHRDLFASR